jgi:hypothetical protein
MQSSMTREAFKHDLGLTNANARMEAPKAVGTWEHALFSFLKCVPMGVPIAFPPFRLRIGLVECVAPDSS